MVFPLAAVLGAAGTIGSALIGGSMASKESRRAEAFAAGGLRRTVTEARKLGIHPAVALGSPVSSAMATPVPSAAPDIVAAGGARAAEQVSGGFDPVTGAQLRLLQAQTRAADASAVDMLSSARSRTLADASRSIGRGGASPTPSIVGPVSMNPGTDWRTSGTSSSAQVGQEYGDIAKEGYGLVRLVHDALMNGGFYGKSGPPSKPYSPPPRGGQYYK